MLLPEEVIEADRQRKGPAHSHQNSTAKSVISYAETVFPPCGLHSPGGDPFHLEVSGSLCWV